MICKTSSRGFFQVFEVLWFLFHELCADNQVVIEVLRPRVVLYAVSCMLNFTAKYEKDIVAERLGEKGRYAIGRVMESN